MQVVAEDKEDVTLELCAQLSSYKHLCDPENLSQMHTGMEFKSYPLPSGWPFPSQTLGWEL